MAKMNAYVQFDGNAREAISFYNECLGGELTLQTYGESPMGQQTPSSLKDKIMHSQIIKGNATFMVADIPDSRGFVKGNNISLCVVCESKDEIETLFSSIGKGGKINHPLNEEFFGIYGDLTDKFGINWMFQFGGSKQT